MLEEYLLRIDDVYSDEWGPGVIYDLFRDEPEMFEAFCAKLLQDMGADIKVTRQTNDGGYDLVFFDGANVVAAECKCFAPDRKVTRPMLQKLAGANAEAGADRMVFLTTGLFTRQARIYGEREGMRLIDGMELSRLVRQYMDLD